VPEHGRNPDVRAPRNFLGRPRVAAFAEHDFCRDEDPLSIGLRIEAHRPLSR
jgi:hypothetical protein